jgi:hypothetical protein
MTVEQALAHPWMTEIDAVPAKDLFPNVRKGFNARKTFKKAIDVVKAVNKLSNTINTQLAGGVAEQGGQFLTVQPGFTRGLSPLASMEDIRVEEGSELDNAISNLQ